MVAHIYQGRDRGSEGAELIVRARTVGEEVEPGAKWYHTYVTTVAPHASIMLPN
jgi:hypothetical protein